MFLKVTRSGPRTYLQIVRSYRDPATGKPKQEHLANLGRIEELAATDLDALIDGLLKVTGRPGLADRAEVETEGVVFDRALELGDVWAVTKIWQQLKLAQSVSRQAEGRRLRIDVEQLIRVMVLNRLSDPCSKLGVLRWLETVWLPGVDRAQMTHQNLLRAMDALLEHKDALEKELASTLLPLFSTEMEVVFYDITALRVHGEAELEGDVRQYGKAKGVDATVRQFAVGLVQTADGFPVSHEVFEGNVGETTTVKGMVTKLLARFPIKRLVLVADRGMLSMDNLDVIEALKLPGGRPVEYILAVPARRCREMTKDLAVLHRSLVEEARRTGAQAVSESEVDGRRLVVAHDVELARQMRLRRARALAEAARLANRLAGRLIDQQEGKPRRGRKLTHNGARVKLRDHLLEHHLTRIIRIDWEDEVFSWDYDVEELKRELMFDGKLVLVSNIQGIPAADVVTRYKSLADIERSFRVAKSTLELAPVYHRLPDRIRAHTLICFLALVIHRVMQARLRRASLALSPERVLYMLKGVQKHRAQLASGTVLEGVTTIKAEQRRLFEALEVDVPTLKEVTAAA